MTEISNKLLGTWQLVHSVVIHDDGHIYHPYGEDAIGCLVYDKRGNMSVQICRKKRPSFTCNTFNDASKEESAHLLKDYLSYFGKYSINESKKIVTHHIAGCLFPNNIGKEIERQYRFYKNKLCLTPCHEKMNREILWEKIH